jgi:uncharacterized membrane protein
MSTKTFSDGEVLKFGWNKIKANFWFFFGVILIVSIITYMPGIMNQFLTSMPWVSLIINFVFMVLQFIVAIGIIKISLKFAGGEKALYSDLFNNFDFFFKYLVSTILYSLIVLAGFILFIVPGIIWSIKFQFFPYFIVDKKAGPVEALKKSAQLTQGAKWDVLGFNILIGLVVLAGFLCLGVGLFAAYPLTWVAFAVVYKKLLQQTEAPGESI